MELAPPPDDAMLVVEHVSKWFGDLVAVSDVSFYVRPGVTALLGPNGAGKSTVLRMLAGLARPSSGTIRVLGMDPRSDPGAAANIGIAPQQEAVFGYLTALQFVRASAELQGVVEADTEARRVLDLVELDPDDDRRLPTYSKGMRQRVKLAQAIVHAPRVIMLDEPLSGLDPRQRLHMVELFHRLADEGRAVIVSSHVLEEVERFGSNVVVISKGRLAAEGDFREIRELMDDRPRRVRVRTDRVRELASALITRPGITGVEIRDEAIELNTIDGVDLALVIAPLAQAAGARLLEVRPLDEDLESVFRYLVAR
ncbi:MAG: ABC transporter ATP-binding protein [Actinomycetota bacterium]